MKEELIKLMTELSEKSYEVGLLAYSCSFHGREKQLENAKTEREKTIEKITEILTMNKGGV